MFPEGRALEFLMVAIAALVFVGPKDLPILLRKLGQFMAKMRAMAAEFRASFDEMARQSELDELRKEVEAMRNAQFSDIAAHAGAPELAQTFDALDQGLTDVGAQFNPGMSLPYASAPTIEVAAAKPARTRKTPTKPAAAKARPATKASAKTSATKATSVKAAPSKTASKPRAAAAKPASTKAAGKVAEAKSS